MAARAPPLRSLLKRPREATPQREEAASHRADEDAPPAAKRQRRVRWAPDDALLSVQLIPAREAQAEALGGRADAAGDGGVAGEGAARLLRLDSWRKEMREQLAWALPPLVLIPPKAAGPPQRVARGRDSVFAREEAEREKTRLAALYPKASMIPFSPAEPPPPLKPTVAEPLAIPFAALLPEPAASAAPAAPPPVAAASASVSSSSSVSASAAAAADPVALLLGNPGLLDGLLSGMGSLASPRAPPPPPPPPPLPAPAPPPPPPPPPPWGAQPPPPLPLPPHGHPPPIDSRFVYSSPQPPPPQPPQQQQPQPPPALWTHSRPVPMPMPMPMHMHMHMPPPPPPPPPPPGPFGAYPPPPPLPPPPHAMPPHPPPPPHAMSPHGMPPPPLGMPQQPPMRPPSPQGRRRGGGGGGGGGGDGRKCIFFTSRVGCRDGSRCRFVHDPDYKASQDEFDRATARRSK
jgi:hypothetical protein